MQLDCRLLSSNHAYFLALGGVGVMSYWVCVRANCHNRNNYYFRFKDSRHKHDPFVWRANSGHLVAALCTMIPLDLRSHILAHNLSRWPEVTPQTKVGFIKVSVSNIHPLKHHKFVLGHQQLQFSKKITGASNLPWSDEFLVYWIPWGSVTHFCVGNGSLLVQVM